MSRFFESPVHICLVGAIVLSAGVSYLVVSSFDWARGMMTFPGGILLIVIGLGILRGSALQRSLFGAMLALSLIGAGILLVGSIITLFMDGEGFGNIDFLIVVLVFLVVLYCFFVLWDARNDSWFSKGRNQGPPAFVIPLTVVLSALLTFVYECFALQQEKAMAEIFRYDVEVVAKDRVSGELIEHLSVSWSAPNFGEVKLPDWVKISGGGSGRPGESSANFHGYGRDSIKFTLRKKGYAQQSIEVNRKTGAKVEIQMVPLSE